MLESGITAKGQTTIPGAVRKVLALAPGDRVRYIVLEEEVRIFKVRPIGHLYGVLRHGGPELTLEDMESAIAAGATLNTDRAE